MSSLLLFAKGCYNIKEIAVQFLAAIERYNVLVNDQNVNFAAVCKGCYKH